MSRNKYRGSSDARMRLRGCLVDHSGSAKLVTEVSMSGTDVRLELDDSQTVSLSEVDIKVPEMGLVTAGSKLKYLMLCSQYPSRQVKAAFCESRVTLEPMGQAPGDVSSGGSFSSKKAYEQLKGLTEYPTFRSAYLKINNNRWYGAALSPDFGLSIHPKFSAIVVYHRSTIVGYVQEETIRLLPSHAYLIQSLSALSGVTVYAD